MLECMPSIIIVVGRINQRGTFLGSLKTINTNYYKNTKIILQHSSCVQVMSYLFVGPVGLGLNTLNDSFRWTSIMIRTLYMSTC